MGEQLDKLIGNVPPTADQSIQFAPKGSERTMTRDENLSMSAKATSPKLKSRNNSVTLPHSQIVSNAKPFLEGIEKI